MDKKQKDEFLVWFMGLGAGLFASLLTQLMGYTEGVALIVSFQMATFVIFGAYLYSIDKDVNK